MDWKSSWHTFLDIGFERTEFKEEYNESYEFTKKISTHQDIDGIEYECKNRPLRCNPHVITNVAEFGLCVGKLMEWTRNMRENGMYFHWVVQFDELPQDLHFYNMHSCYWLPTYVDKVKIVWRGIDIDRNFDHILPCQNLFRSIVSCMQVHGFLVKLSHESQEDIYKTYDDNNVSFEDVSFACALQKIRDEGLGSGCVLPPDVIDRIFVMATNGAYLPKRDSKGIINQRESDDADAQRDDDGGARGWPTDGGPKVSESDTLARYYELYLDGRLDTGL